MSKRDGVWSQDYVITRQCHQCGEKFAMLVPQEYYGYAIRDRKLQKLVVFCSYKCMRRYEQPILDQARAEMAEAFEAARLEEEGANDE